MTPRALSLRVCIALVCFSGCGPGSFAPPDSPAHDDGVEGAPHALGKKYPFLCGDPEDPMHAIECTGPRPPDRLLSCDAAGCHGSYDFSVPGGQASGRHLFGSEGASCFTCHDETWDDDRTGGRKREGGDD